MMEIKGRKEIRILQIPICIIGIETYFAASRKVSLFRRAADGLPKLF